MSQTTWVAATLSEAEWCAKARARRLAPSCYRVIEPTPGNRRSNLLKLTSLATKPWTANQMSDRHADYTKLAIDMPGLENPNYRRA